MSTLQKILLSNQNMVAEAKKIESTESISDSPECLFEEYYKLYLNVSSKSEFTV